MRERERERETYQWEEEKIVMNRKKNLLVDGGGRDCRATRDTKVGWEGERELWSMSVSVKIVMNTVFCTEEF